MATDNRRKGAATSLKYAKATDLPSFPSHGGESNAAGTAAMLAKDYKMKELWQPEQSMAGSRAAVKAQKDGGKLDLWQYEGSKNGLSAAALAMRKNTQTPLSPSIDRGYTDAGKNNSLLAATKSTKSSRQRSDSTPVRPPPLYPDEKNSARNALSAATASHRNSVRAPPAKKEEGWSSEANQAARIKNSHMDRDMFGSNPQVEPEVEEKKREAALRASAVSMAKKMYDVQNRAMLANASDTASIGSAGAETAHRRNTSAISQSDLKQEAMKYITLQDQAHKLAQERLAKVDKEMENSRYREYYGYSDKSPRKSRLSIRGRTRNRASSEGADRSDSDDEEQARRIRSQMSQLNTASNNVSDKQREEDRARLLKAAEKRVHDRMHDMDEKVFLETGKPTQAMMDDWEAKAREKAQKDRAERDKHPGKTHIGGGKYMDQSEIEAIAAARLKPTLAELDENATKRREREEEIQRKRDQAETERMEEKMRDQAQKAEFKRIKGKSHSFVLVDIDADMMIEQDKAAARKEKEERKAAQREEKARKSEDKRKSREVKREEVSAVAGGAALGEVAQKVKDDNEPVEEPQQQDVKEKRKSRGVFGRLTDKFRKDDKPATQAEKAEEKHAEDTSKDPQNDYGETGAAAALVGGAAVGSTGVHSAVDEDKDKDSLYEVSERNAVGPPEVESRSDYESTRDNRDSTIDRKEDEGPSHAGTAAAIAAGTAGAGALAWATIRSNEDAAGGRGEVSSLSTDSDDERDLEQVETAHSVQPLQSPAIEKRPDLERHISTIGTSSGESDLDDDDEGLFDSDDELDERGRGRTGAGGQGLFATTERADGGPAAAAGGEEPVSPLREDERAERATVPAAVPLPVLVPPPKERDDDVVHQPEQQKVEPEAAAPVEKIEPAPVAPIAKTEPAPVAPIEKTEPAPVAPIEKTDPAPVAQPPVVATGPSAVEPKGKEAEKPKEEKEKSGLRGLISRLKGRDKDTKSDGKLHKNRAASEQEKDKSFQGGAKLASTDQKRDETTASAAGGNDIITPVTTTSAGRTAEGAAAPEPTTATGTLDDNSKAPLPLHIGTDGPIGDPEGRVAVAQNANTEEHPTSPTSESSFKRHDAALRDPDDVSSSGAEEEDVKRGRAGRFARKLGFGRHKDHADHDNKDSHREEGKEGAGKIPDEPPQLPALTTTSASQSRTGRGESQSEEQFEEARDTFDESLAPPAAFAGQPKSQSPVRETKFVERF